MRGPIRDLRGPALAGVLTIAAAGIAAVTGSPPAPANTATATASVATPAPLRTHVNLRESVDSARAESAASRANVRAAAVPSVTPAQAPPPRPAPIVGSFLPVEGCDATVPTVEPPNGQLALDELCTIGDRHLLRADAAATYLAMNAAFAAEFGVPLAITDSYRDVGTQSRLYSQKPGLAARPGTSNHGWGVAVDLFGGVDSYGSAEHAWLTEHGSEYGWVNPEWALAGGSRPEPWHWEFDPSLLG